MIYYGGKTKRKHCPRLYVVDQVEIEGKAYKYGVPRELLRNPKYTSKACRANGNR